MSFTIEAISKINVCRLNVEVNTTVEQLKSKLLEIYNAPNVVLALAYTGPKGDLFGIRTDEDLKNAFDEFAEQRALKIFVRPIWRAGGCDGAESEGFRLILP
jgi:hypothetical protein